MVVSNPKEIIPEWREFYQMKKVENKVFVVAVVLGVFDCCLFFLTERHTQSNLSPRQSRFTWLGNQDIYSEIHKLLKTLHYCVQRTLPLQRLYHGSFPKIIIPIGEKKIIQT